MDPVQATESVSSLSEAFARFGPAGAAVLGVVVVVGIFAWLAIKLSNKLAESMAAVQAGFSQRTQEIADACHARHADAQAQYTRSLELVVGAHDKEAAGLRQTLVEFAQSNRRVEEGLTRLLERREAS